MPSNIQKQPLEKTASDLCAGDVLKDHKSRGYMVTDVEVRGTDVDVTFDDGTIDRYASATLVTVY